MPAKKTTTAAVKATETVKKAAPRRRRKVTHEMIETRAYHISQSDYAGSPEENWFAAERELLGQT